MIVGTLRGSLNLLRYCDRTRPKAHLKDFSGILQADGYAGFDAIYASGRVSEAACWAHARRKYFDLHAATG